MTIAYDGTGLVGWQRQGSGTSVQGLIEDALRELDARDPVVTGAGRTDAGVHALGQVACASLNRVIDAVSLVRALNARLPDQVRVIDALEVPPSFHPRFGARSKTYRYRICNAEILSPFERAYAWHIPVPPLDVNAMAAAAIQIEGRHDFAAFQAAGSDTRTTEREIFSSQVYCGPGAPNSDRHDDDGRKIDDGDPQRRRAGPDACFGSIITYEIKGNGFLRHMVRNIAGTLVEIGRGRHSAEWIREVLSTRSRPLAGPTAPAAGLCLVGVDYD